MTSERSNNLQNLALALFIGLAVPPGIGFGFGFWVTKESAEQKLNSAVLMTQVAVCVGQFSSDPNSKKMLGEFKALDYGAKSAFLEKGGWARMPGEEKPRSNVMQECASRLDALAQK